MPSRLKRWQHRWRVLRHRRSTPDNNDDDGSFEVVDAATDDTSDHSRHWDDADETDGSTSSNEDLPRRQDDPDRPWNSKLFANEIRVIDILPSESEDDTLACTIRYLKLPARKTGPQEKDNDHAPWMHQPPSREPYFTLSYAWGETFADDSHLTHTIHRNGEPMRITANLHAVLKQIRRLHRDRRVEADVPIWIDYLCINQANIEERSQQVRQMDRIYQLSEKLLIWLGEVEDSADEQFLGKLSATCAAYPSDELDPEDWERNRILGRQTGFTDDDRRAMQRVCRRPWFKRRWVIQEAYYKSSDRRRICIGGFMIEGHRLERALSEMRLLDRTPALERAQYQQRPILYNLQIYHTTECSDPRDYVYALASVSLERRNLAIDYSLYTWQMYTEFAREFVSVNLLISATTRASRRIGSLASMPSWVPDWRVPVRYRSHYHERAVTQFLKGTRLFDPNVRLHEGDSDLLLVTGRLVAVCPHAKLCQEFRCDCIACRVSRTAIRSGEGVPIVAGLTEDAGIPPRALLLVDDCPIAFWLERCEPLPPRKPLSTDATTNKVEDIASGTVPRYRLTTSVALPPHITVRDIPVLLADVPMQTVVIR